MSDLPRLEQGFGRGEFVRPGAGPGFLDLVRALAAACGADDDRGPHAELFAPHLDGADHVVLVLVDGLGVHFIEELPDGAWLRRHLVQGLEAVFPATTAAALTTLATGESVARHGAVGWWSYLPLLDDVVELLPFRRLSDERALEALGIEAPAVFAGSPLISRMSRDAAVVTPRPIADSSYSRFLAGGARRFSSGPSVRSGARLVRERLRGAGGPTYTYWYVSKVDTLAHELGTAHQRTRAAVREVDDSLRWLAEDAGLPSSTALIVTADHGHLDVAAEGRRPILPDDPLIERLRCHPSGDMRAVFWHLAEGATSADHAAFREGFRERFGQAWALISTDELEQLRLMGPEPLAAETRRRVGDYTAISLGREVMRYAPPGHRPVLGELVSHHSGLSRAEMTVPFVLART